MTQTSNRKKKRLDNKNSVSSSKSISTTSTTKEEEMGKNKKNKHNTSKSKIFKMSSKQRKKHRKSQQTIRKLMEDFHNNSNTSIFCTPNDTVIVLDDTIRTPESKKRKLSETDFVEQNKCMKIEEGHPSASNDDILIIHDETVISQTPRKNLNSAPIDCSTPIQNIIKNSNTNNNTTTVENFNVDLNNLTKEINQDSYLTIDLTTESNANKTSIGNTQFNTVIDLDNPNDSQDCAFVSMSNTSLSLSGESDVTVLHNPKAKRNSENKQMNKFVNGISKLDASEKGKLLELITQKIFNGCKVPKRIKRSVSAVKASIDQTTETAEDTYIKEVILGDKKSRNSIGSNIYNPDKDWNKSGLRLVVIDGSNVAMDHSKGKHFSVKGLKICIDYFLNRGHVVKAFVPRFRCKFGKSTEPRVLDDLERRGLVVYTPSREIQGRMVTSYDDRYIVQCAAEFDGVIVSGDNYRDLLQENPRWRFIIENRLLQFTWVNDMIMFPRDPLGRNGPTLEQFLRHPTQQPKAMTSLFNIK